MEKQRLTDEDLQALEREVMENPEAGDLIAGTGGLRKIRFAPPSWNMGKRGATRICYAFFARIEAVYLLELFAKNEKANLSATDKATARVWMQMMKDRLGTE